MFQYLLIKYTFILLFKVGLWKIIPTLIPLVAFPVVTGGVFMLLVILSFILMAAFLTLYERQVLAAMQRRKGPNVVGFMGLLQAIADAVKLLFKEQPQPIAVSIIAFVGASVYVVTLSLLIWATLPVEYGAVLMDSNVAVLYFLSISGLSVYGIIVAGWSSNSRYPFLGSLRACAQLLSYELTISASFLIIFLYTGTLNITEIVLSQQKSGMWLCWLTLPIFFIWFICTVAETYRAPFDLAEAESELVSGFNVEYSGMTFAFLFLGEYIHIVVMSNLMTLIFLGGWLPLYVGVPYINAIMAALPISGYVWYSAKVVILIFAFIWVRATFPRFRYDQLMSLGWKILLPLTCLLFWIAIASMSLVFVLMGC